MMIYALYSYVKLYRNTRESIQSSDGTWICDRIDTPFILGIIRPRIFLPSAEHVAQNSYVIAHERAHLARHDHWWKSLVLCVLVAFCFMTDPKSAQGYSDAQLTKMALDYYTSHNNIVKSDKMHVVIDHEAKDGDQQLVTIWIYGDTGDEEGARGATHAWYTVDRKTAKGYEETTFEDVDLTE